MASYGTNTIQRSSTTSSPSASRPTDESSKDSTRQTRKGFTLICPFGIPPTPEAAAVRIIRNLAYFGLYYAIFIWVILFIALLPKRKLSLILLVVMTALTSLYLLLLRPLPLLQRIIDKRLVLALLFMVTTLEMILTRAAVHFFVTLGAAAPVILLHAVFRVRENLFVSEEASAAGELVPLMERKTGGSEPSDSV
ncbi:hypothetical protein NMG60_11023174 [Bertholletia excelsa]